jgi:hypothetical protein
MRLDYIIQTIAATLCAAVLDEYKAANVWNTIADRIKPLSEYTSS